MEAVERFNYQWREVEDQEVSEEDRRGGVSLCSNWKLTRRNGCRASRVVVSVVGNCRGGINAIVVGPLAVCVGRMRGKFAMPKRVGCSQRGHTLWLLVKCLFS